MARLQDCQGESRTQVVRWRAPWFSLR